MSCLIAKLSHYVDLSDDDCELLTLLEKDEQSFQAGSMVHAAGADVDFLYVVKQGWLYNDIDLPDGRRQIVRIHHPGDILGLGDIAYHNAGSNLRACDDVILCPFPKQHLDAVFTRTPRLTALLFTIAVRDQAVLIDMLKSIARLSARERLAYVLLDLLSRLRVTHPEITDTFECPLNLSELGDVVALTSVYVKKTLQALVDDKLLRMDGQQVTLLDTAELARICEFEERYAAIDTDWFPGG